MSLLKEVRADILSGDVIQVTELVSEFISMVGEGGLQAGLQGPQGFQGDPGAPGAPGAPGGQGSQGTQGFQGEPGSSSGGSVSTTMVADGTDFYLTAFQTGAGFGQQSFASFLPVAMTFDPILFGASTLDVSLVYGRVYFCSLRVPANVTITGAILLPSEAATVSSSLYVGLYSPSRTVVAETILAPVTTGKKGFINKYPFDAPYVTPAAGVYTLAFTIASSAGSQTFFALNSTIWQTFFVFAQDNFTTPSTEIRVRCGYVQYSNIGGVGSKFPTITSDTIIEQNSIPIWAGLY